MSALAKKLVEVMAAVERIPKNGWNDFHKYAYATEADIADALRGELSSRGVLLLPSVVSALREPVGEKGSVLTHLYMEFTFMDSETGEQLTRPWLGAGTDKEDKGAYKAMTGGEKYFLLKTFLIPTGDDPEATEGTEPPRQQRAAKPTPVPSRTAAPTPRQPKDSRDGVRVVNVKKAKTGTSAKGPWTLFVVTFTDQTEGKTFSTTIANAAMQAQRDGAIVLPVLNAKNELEALDRVAS